MFVMTHRSMTFCERQAMIGRNQNSGYGSSLDRRHQLQTHEIYVMKMRICIRRSAKVTVSVPLECTY